MTPPKVVVLDVDHTLAAAGDEIHSTTRTALDRLRADAIPCVLATGRPIPSALRIARKINAPMVAALGGSVVLHVATGDLLWSAVSDLGWAHDSWLWFQTMGMRVQAHTLTGWYATILDEETAAYAERHDLPPAKSGPPKEAVLLVELVGRSDTVTVDVITQIIGGVLPPVSPGHNALYMDFTPTGGDKAAGTGRMIDILGCDWGDVLAMGDGGNDVPLLKRAATAVAIGDAGPELLAIATHHVKLKAGNGAVGSGLLALLYQEPAHLPHVDVLNS